MERTAFLNMLAESFSAYYDILPEADAQGLPLAFRADFFSRSEKYWLSKNIPIWGNETNEFAYVYSAESFDEALVDRCVGFALSEALPRVKPHKEHQYTNVKVVFVADSFDNAVVKRICAKKFSKNYKLSFHGFTMLKTVAVDLSLEQAFPNRAGHELSDYFKKLFAAGRKANRSV